MGGDINGIYNNSIRSVHKKTEISFAQGRTLKLKPVEDKLELSGKTVNKANDGKFSISEAAKNYGKGLISPITTMFSSVKNFVIAAGMMVGAAGLIIATGGWATPVLISAGVGMGVFQAGIAAVKVIKAKDGDDVEKAFYDAGAATSTLGLSAFGVKASLRSAGINTENMNTFNAIIKCFTSSRESVVNSFNAFKSGAWKGNFEAAFKPFTQNQELRKQSIALAKEAIVKCKEATDEILRILPEEMRGQLKSRPKSASSLYDKLKRGKNIKDLIGTRLILDDASPVQIDKLVNNLANALRKGEIKITEISNYRGPNGKPYFTDAHIIKLKKAALKSNQEIIFTEGQKLIKDSGYTTTQIDIVHKNGARGEFQIRGKHTHKMAELEHIAYDLREKKDLSKGIGQLKELFKPVEKAMQALNKNEAQRTAYESYLAEMFNYYREIEIGLMPKKPELPKGFDPILSVESLENLHNQAAIITKNHAMSKTAKRFASTAVFSGINPFIDNIDNKN